MKLRFGLCALVTVLTLLGSAPAQPPSNPLRGSSPSRPTAGPDQPVQPQLPTLERRAVPQAEPQAAQPPAQQAPPQAPFTLTPDEEAQLNRVLKQWEDHNRTIKTFDCRFQRWIYDKISGPADRPKFSEAGMLRYQAPDRGMFCVDLVEKDGKFVKIEDARAEHWIADGKSIFEFKHDQRQLVEHQLPPELQGKGIADSPLPFLFGADATKLKQRYWIKIIPPKNQLDQIELLAYPKFQREAANFKYAQFIINAKGMTPFALLLKQPNGKDSTRYLFSEIVVNDPLRLFKGDPFRASTPLGWQKIVMPPQGPDPAPGDVQARPQARRSPNERR